MLICSISVFTGVQELIIDVVPNTQSLLLKAVVLPVEEKINWSLHWLLMK